MHEWVSTIICNATILIMVVALMQEIAEEDDASAIINSICGWLVVCMVFGAVFVYLVPVECNKSGCKGRMQPGWDREESVQWRLFYRCRLFDNLYFTHFTFRIGGWD